MRRLDRTGLLIFALACFALYLGLTNLLGFLGVVYLPLGGLGDEVVLFLLAMVVVELYARQRKGGRSHISSSSSRA